MKVRLIRKKTIENYILQNAGSRSSFRLWLTFLKQADWTRPGDIAETFGLADLLGKGCNRVVFNIAGNNYRMICKYQFGLTRMHLSIKWLGTHAAYTQLCNKNEQYTVSAY